MGFTLLQHDYNNVGTGPVSTLVKAFTNNPAVGNVVCVGGYVWNGTSTSPTITVTDGNSNTYTKAPHSPALGDPTNAGISYAAYFIASGTPNKTITVTSSRSEDTITMWIAEFAVSGGTAAFDNDAAGSGASGTTINAPSIPVAGSGELIFGVAVPDNQITAVGGSWTAVHTIPAGNFDGGEYQLSVSANTTLNFTQNSSGGWASMGMSFSFTPSAVTFVPRNTYQAPILTQ